MNTYAIGDIQKFLSQTYGNWKTQSDGSRAWVVPDLTVFPYAYVSTFGALAQNASLTNTLQITANADFICIAIRYRSQIGAAQTVSTKTAAFIRMLITDQGTGEQFTAQAIDLENYASNGAAILPLAYPRFISGKASLTIQLTNYAPTAETYTSTDISLVGLQVRQRS